MTNAVIPSPTVDWAALTWGTNEGANGRRQILFHVLGPPRRPDGICWSWEERADVPVVTESICSHALPNLREVPFEERWMADGWWYDRPCAKCVNLIWNGAAYAAQDEANVGLET